MILERAPEDEPVIPTERAKIRLEMMRTKKRMLNKENPPVNNSFTADRTIEKWIQENEMRRKTCMGNPISTILSYSKVRILAQLRIVRLGLNDVFLIKIA